MQIFLNINTPAVDKFAFLFSYPHITKLVWPSSGPHKALALGRHTTKNDSPPVALIWFARAGSNMGSIVV